MTPYDMREDLTPRRVTNAMWDYSWLKCHYPGGPYEDWDKVTDELLERGFNTVRIDAYPLVIGALESLDQPLVFGEDPLKNWGPSVGEHEHKVPGGLVEFMTILRKKGIYAILSSWGHTISQLCKTEGSKLDDFTDRDLFKAAWVRTLDLLKENDLLSHVLYVDLDQEFPYFSPFNKALQQAGVVDSTAGTSMEDAMEAAGQRQGSLTQSAWIPPQLAYVQKLFMDMIPFFQNRYPGTRFTYSLTTFWKEIRSLGLRLFDTLELHIWIHSPRYDNRLAPIIKDRGDHDYRDHQGRIDKAMSIMKPMFVREMHNKLTAAKSWSEEIAAPVITTESWGPWWHMDHPHLRWDWLSDWCAQCMKLAADYGFWGVTPWNYAHPYWKNWSNVAWYRRVNDAFLKS